MLSPKTKTLEFVCSFAGVPQGFSEVSASVSTAGEALLLLVGNDAAGHVHARDDRTGASFPRTHMPEAKPFRLTSVRPGGIAIDIPPLEITFPLVDLFPDGRILMAASRCQWRGPDDYDRNGVIFDPKSGSLKRILLGDGIADIGVDARGRIWASYFDEGVFGNFGWGMPGPGGPGRGGLTCFDDDGRILWQFNSDHDAPIADCYALNATPEAMWAYYYMAFEICRVGMDFSKTIWPPPEVAGAHAFAVCDKAFLFASGYGAPKDKVHLVRREGEKLGKTTILSVAAPDGESLDGSTVVGRGKYLHFLNRRGWFRADADALAGD